MRSIDSVIDQQIEYYKARSSEYDEWFLRQGRYDQGPKLNQLWRDEINEVQKALKHFNPEGKALEIACGTGLWTQVLLDYDVTLTAVDAAIEVLELNRKRLSDKNIEYIKANIFDWKPTEKYDFIFFSFWLSHVPDTYFEQFWNKVENALLSNGKVFFIDSKFDQTSTANNQKLTNNNEQITTRILNNGKSFEIVKVFYEPKTLTDRLSKMGWNIKVEETERYFIYGHGDKGK